MYRDADVIQSPAYKLLFYILVLPRGYLRIGCSITVFLTYCLLIFLWKKKKKIKK